MVHAKKSLGQNFLMYPKATNRIAEIVRAQKIKTVIEIGPGKGALTKPLLEKTDATIYVIELDDRMVELLNEKFAEYVAHKRLHIIHCDVLDIDIREVTKEKNYGLVGNLPFYITGAIMKKFLTEDHQPTYMSFITQKEVAERIVKRDGKESILSLSVEIFGTPKYEMKIAKKYFSPVPKVDAALFSIFDINRAKLGSLQEDRFFEIVKTGFAHKRKKLSSNLKHAFKEPIETVFQDLHIDTNSRAEDIPLNIWLALAARQDPVLQ
jgi:16S rRNA (adenine1518-N6/adenine1519-N6)-dimethyltransferase